MANHKSAKKRLRQDINKNIHNRTIRSTVRTVIKKARKAVADGDTAAANDLVKKAEKTIATAANKGIYHKNNAARKISRLVRLVQKAQA